MSKTTLAGAAVLVIPTGFVLVNVLQYIVGVPVAWNPYQALLESARATPWRYLVELVILASPLAAFALMILPSVRVARSRVEGELASIVIRRGSTPALLLMGGCLLVLAIMGIYLVGENLPCILGQAVSC